MLNIKEDTIIKLIIKWGLKTSKKQYKFRFRGKEVRKLYVGKFQRKMNHKLFIYSSLR
jgi:hypothetical protein